jgi:hypothetical protein
MKLRSQSISKLGINIDVVGSASRAMMYSRHFCSRAQNKIITGELFFYGHVIVTLTSMV